MIRDIITDSGRLVSAVDIMEHNRCPEEKMKTCALQHCDSRLRTECQYIMSWRMKHENIQRNLQRIEEKPATFTFGDLR